MSYLERPDFARKLGTAPDKQRTRSSSPAPRRSEVNRVKTEGQRSRSSEAAGTSRSLFSSRARSRSPSPRPSEPKRGNI